ncbi:MAG: hypothetical protein DSO01_08215, partial [Archaeoglobi archaeon]
MRKEGERMKKYGLIGLMLLVMLATPAMAQPSPNPGPISVPELGINSMKILDDDGIVTYGETVKIVVYYEVPDPNIYGSRYVGIYEWSKYE